MRLSKGKYKVACVRATILVLWLATGGSGMAADTDADGMDDAWEMAMFGHLGQGPGMDFDKDGTTDVIEAHLGLDPRDGRSRFAPAWRDSSLEWTGAAGCQFAIQRSRMDGDGWATVAIRGGVAGMNQWTDPGALPDRVFYRIACYKPEAGGYLPITSLAWIGDSTTADSSAAPYPDGTSTVFQASHVNAALWWSGLEIPVVHDPLANPAVPARTFAISGSRSWHLPAQVARLMSVPKRPSHCGIKIGTNDVANGVSQADTLGFVRSVFQQLRDGGVEPILYTITPWRLEDPVRAATVVALNQAYETLAAEHHVLFVDCRAATESAPGTEWDGMLFDNLHDNSQNAYHYGKAAAAAMGPRLSGALPSVWSAGGAANPEDAWQSLPSQSSPPAGTTTTQVLVARTDGVPGNWLRATIQDKINPTIGSGNAGVVYTPVAPWTKSQIHVVHRRDLNFANGGVPAIQVYPTPEGRRILEVRLETVSFVVQNTAAAVAAAVLAHPEASSLVTPSATGNGSAACAFGNSTESWSIYTNGLANPPAGKWVRAMVELDLPPGSHFLGLSLYRNTPQSGALCSVPVSARLNSLTLPAGKLVVYTPWHVVAPGDSGFKGIVRIGGELGAYHIGRFWVQEK